MDWPQLDACLDVAHQAFQARDGWLPRHERIAVLERFAHLLQEEREDFLRRIVQEGGKPWSDAAVEVDRAIHGVRCAIDALGHLAGTEIPVQLTPSGAGRIAFTSYEPVGVVLVISAFNHPLNLIIHQAIPAVAAGCPVLIKPAPLTPLCGKRVVELLHEAGLPPAWAQLCCSDIPNAEKMVRDRRVAFLSFIGSAKVGWYLRSVLAPGTRCALEHGGAAPIIVDEGVAQEAVIPPLLKGGYYHAGQVCVSVQRVFAPRAEAASLAEQLAAGAAALSVGDPAQRETEVGPLILPREVQRVDEWVQEAVAGGAGLLCGGAALGETLYAPTVLLHPPPEARVSSQEVFGPVVCVYGYDRVEQALEQANSLDYAFQAGVFGNRLDVILHLVKGLDASAVMVNDHSAFRTDEMPFAGRRASGLGVGGIGHTLQDMVQHKMVLINGW